MNLKCRTREMRSGALNLLQATVSLSIVSPCKDNGLGRQCSVLKQQHYHQHKIRTGLILRIDPSSSFPGCLSSKLSLPSLQIKTLTWNDNKGHAISGRPKSTLGCLVLEGRFPLWASPIVQFPGGWLHRLNFCKEWIGSLNEVRTRSDFKRNQRTLRSKALQR